MILIDTKTVDGVIYPIKEIPQDCIAKMFNGGQYVCYQKGDIVPAIDYNDHPLDLSDERNISEGLFQKLLNDEQNSLNYWACVKQFLANHPDLLPPPNIKAQPSDVKPV